MTYERYKTFLDQNAFAYELIVHQPVRTIEDVNRHVPELLPTMVKTIAFCIDGSQLVLVAVRGADRIDYKKLAAHFGVNRRQVKTLAPEQVSAELQVEPGAVAPIILSSTQQLIIDQAVSKMPLIHTGSGRFSETIAIDPKQLISACDAKVLDVVK